MKTSMFSMRKKLLAIFVSIAMVVAFMPAMATAEDAAVAEEKATPVVATETAQESTEAAVAQESSVEAAQETEAVEAETSAIEATEPATEATQPEEGTPAAETPAVEQVVPQTEESVAPQAGFFTVSFTVNGTQVDSQIVADGDRATQPENPAIPAGYLSFIGWYYNGAEYNFSSAVTQDITLEANFSNKYLVQFADKDGKIIESKQVEAGQPVSATTMVIVPPLGKDFEGWALNGTLYDFTQPVNDNITLVPSFVDSSYVTFVIYFVSKGSAASPQVVHEGTTASKPADPTRAGYTFKYWSATDGGSEFDFANTPITDDTTLYAVWEATNVEYTVVYWEEKAGIAGDPGTNSANYEFYGSTSKTALAGSTVTAVAADCPTINYFTFNFADSQVVAGTGTTIVNVYYSRIVYTLAFHLGAGTMVKDGVTYTGDEYSFQAKYQAPIDAEWPSTKNATIANNDGTDFIYWTVPGASYAYASHRLIIDDDMLTDLAAGATQLDATATYGPVRVIRANYWLEQIPGQAIGSETTEKDGVTYEMSPEYSQYLNSSINSNFVGKRIEGFEGVKGAAAVKTTEEYNGATIDVYNFYYPRLKFDLSFDTQGGNDIATVPEVFYQKSLSEYKPADPTRANYVFKGWYYDADFTLPFSFDTTTMPQNDLCVFAKWEPSQYNANFFNHAGDTTPVVTQGIAQDSYVADPNIYTIGQGYDGLGEFQGWYWFLPETTKYVSYYWETPVASDVNLYGQWRTDGFKVTYNAGEGTGAVPTDSNTYSVGTLALTQNATAIVPPAGKVFVGWSKVGETRTYYPGNTISMNDDVELTARFIDPENAVTLTYDENFEGFTNQQSVVVEKNDNVVLMNNMFGEHGQWQFAGWNTAADGSGTQYAEGDAMRVPADTTLYAQWREASTPAANITVKYEWVSTENPASAVLPGDDSPVAGQPYTAEAVSAIDGWTFSGWFTDQACTQRFIDGTVLNEDVTLYGKWTKTGAVTPVVTPTTSGTPYYTAAKASTTAYSASAKTSDNVWALGTAAIVVALAAGVLVIARRKQQQQD